MANLYRQIFFSYVLRKPRHVIFSRTIQSSALSQNPVEGGESESASNQKRKKKMDDYFIDPKVQTILMKITGMDYGKIFRPRKEPLQPPKYEFVSIERLKELQEEAREKALKKLQMPPVMEIREPIDDVMSYDPELQGFKDSKLVFIDTTHKVSDRDRFITVREPDGTLRQANWDERFKMNQIFFPLHGRELYTPALFESANLEKLLDEESYVYVLDRACIQFEPDDGEYHRVTHAVFDHINQHKKFDVLRSTRHFGPMAFYFAWEKRIEKLLVDMIERDKLSDAADLIKLLHTFHPELQTSEQKDLPDLELVEEFVKMNSSKYKADLELALQTYIESKQDSDEPDDARREARS